MRASIALIALGLSLACQAEPKIAVTDLAYEEQVREQIRTVSAHSHMQANGFATSATSSYEEVEDVRKYIERGELRKFTGDIKGEILRSGLFQLVQGRPHSGVENGEGLHDVIQRIELGQFEGADYVLFGSLSDIDFREDLNDIANTDSYSKVLGLTLVADFSLIDTRTHEVTAAFTAMGEAQDVRLVNGNDIRATPNRGRVIREVSKSIGEDVTRQLKEQLLGEYDDGTDAQSGPGQLPPDEPPRILR